METYPITFFNNHALIEKNNEVILIDTGSPYTIHHAKSFQWMGRNVNTTTNLVNVTVASVSHLLEKQIHTLLGTDLLKDYHVLLDYRNHEFTVSREEIPFQGRTANLEMVMGLPVIELVIKEKPVRCFLDTGAMLSYLPPAITADSAPTGQASDFQPFVGRFETPTYHLEANFQGERFSATFGNLPLVLQSALTPGGVEGIIGYDFLAQFSVVLDMQNNTMRFSRNL